MNNQDYYGYGVIQNPYNMSLNTPNNAMKQGGSQIVKEPMGYQFGEKVNKDAPNRYQVYFAESVDKQNYDENAQVKLDRGLDYSEHAENQNLDFDNDGEPDLDFQEMRAIIENRETDEEAQKILEDIKEANIEKEDILQPNDPLEEKSIGKQTIRDKMQDKPLIETSNNELLGQDQPLKWEKPRNELKENTANHSPKQISMADGVVMATGGMALAMMLLSRAV